MQPHGQTFCKLHIEQCKCCQATPKKRMTLKETRLLCNPFRLLRLATHQCFHCHLCYLHRMCLFGSVVLSAHEFQYGWRLSSKVACLWSTRMCFIKLPLSATVMRTKGHDALAAAALSLTIVFKNPSIYFIKVSLSKIIVEKFAITSRFKSRRREPLWFTINPHK